MKQLIKKLSEPKYFLIFSVGYTLFITYSFLTSTKGVPLLRFFLADKLVHGIIHTLLVFFWLYYFSRSKQSILRVLEITVIAILCASYGIIIEILQEVYTASREADIYDVVANCIGTSLGVFLFLQLRRRFYNLNM